jgi:hypothetical protein
MFSSNGLAKQAKDSCRKLLRRASEDRFPLVAREGIDFSADRRRLMRIYRSEDTKFEKIEILCLLKFPVFASSTSLYHPKYLCMN